MDSMQAIIDALVANRTNEGFGLRPYKPGYDFPQDVGLGGISTEYLATDVDPNGQVVNYPQIWYDNQGMANVLPQDQAMQVAMDYENNSGLRFPRFNSIGSASTFAENRSAMGGAEEKALASLLGNRNW